MKTAQHTFTTATGQTTVTVKIHCMSGVEAVDIFDLDAASFDAGGWLIEGFIEGKPCGVEFINPAHRDYLAHDAETVALGFIDPEAAATVQTAELAEFAVMTGIPFKAADEILSRLGQTHIHRQITNGAVMHG